MRAKATKHSAIVACLLCTQLLLCFKRFITKLVITRWECISVDNTVRKKSLCILIVFSFMQMFLIVLYATHDFRITGVFVRIKACNFLERKFRWEQQFLNKAVA